MTRVRAKKTGRYTFSSGISPIERKWILESIGFLKGLGAPISEDIHFKHITGYKLIGDCSTGEDSIEAECTIGLSVHLMIDGGDERTFKEVCIHELLHTIKNRAKDPHKGSWKKWADRVNSWQSPDDPNRWYLITERFLKNNIRRAKKAADVRKAKQKEGQESL